MWHGFCTSIIICDWPCQWPGLWAPCGTDVLLSHPVLRSPPLYVAWIILIHTFLWLTLSMTRFVGPIQHAEWHRWATCIFTRASTNSNFRLRVGKDYSVLSEFFLGLIFRKPHIILWTFFFRVFSHCYLFRIISFYGPLPMTNISTGGSFLLAFPGGDSGL